MNPKQPNDPTAHALVTKYKLTDVMQFSGKAIKSCNQEKKQWGWKML